MDSWIGRPLPRREDDRLLRGTRVGVADLHLPGTVELAFVRSEIAHADLAPVDASPARAVPGVVGAWSAADLGSPDVPSPGDPDGARPWPALARDRVRFFGEPVAVVAALDRYVAEDGVDAVAAGVRLTPRPAVVDPRAALAVDAPRLHDGGSNLLLERTAGEPVDDVLATAPVVVEATYRQELVQHTSMEARSVLVRPDDDGGFTVWVSHQGQHILRDALARTFDVEPRLVRVVVPDAGGAFGGKSGTWQEYVVAVAVARELGRPARWTEDRAEALQCAPRGRGQWQTVRLAADRDGRLLALDLEIVADVGGYAAQGSMVPHMSSLVACGPYALDRAYVRSRTVLTTTAPTSAYRGAGRPEGSYQIERTLDGLATRLGIDPAELRRRNFLPPDVFPHRTPTGALYDSGDYGRAFELLMSELDYDGLRAEQRARRADPGGTRLGIGLCCYVERSGAADRSPEFGAVEVTAEGAIIATTGSTATGQGHETSFPQVVAEVLGVDVDRIRLVARDTREVREGHGSFGSRSMQVGGGALWRASEGLVRLARERVAASCNVPVGDTAYADGRVTGPDGLDLGLAEIAGRTGPLRTEDVFAPPQAFPFGCYAAVVEVDTALGHVEVRRLVAVDDYGTVVNPHIVEGQTTGSIAQGLGQALYESMAYDDDGRPPARTLLDYLLPTAAEIPPLTLRETETPNPHQPFGAKGAGEAGCIGVPPAVLNAVADALGITVPDRLQLPAFPDQVWRLGREGADPVAAGCPHDGVA